MERFFQAVMGIVIWWLSLLWVIYIIVISLPLNNNSNNYDITTTFILGLLCIGCVVFVNISIFSLKSENNRLPILAMTTALLFLIIIMLTPSRISGGIVRSLGLGNISNASLLVTANACKALEQLDDKLCKPNGDVGEISHADIVSRIGGEYLLVFHFKKSTLPKSCETSSDKTSCILRTTIKGDDVLSYTTVEPPVK